MVHAPRAAALALLLLGAAGCSGPAPVSDEGAGFGQVPPSLSLHAVSGGTVAPLRARRAAAQVFLFVRSDCPIANRYAPEIRGLREEYAGRGVAFWLVYVDPEEDDALIEQHRSDYGLDLPALRDDAHALVEVSGAAVTPTALVVEPEGRIVYRGRIDARYTGFGKARKGSGRRDLAEALEDLLSGRPVEIASTEAVGCFIRDLTP